MATIQADKITLENTRFFGLFMGRSSSGKDVAAMTFPRSTLVLDFDLRKGAFSQRACKIYEKMGLPGLKSITIETFPPLSTNWASVEKYMESLWTQYCNRQRPYDTIVLASLGSMVRCFMNESVEDRSKPGKFTTSAPIDYKFEGQVALQVLDYLRSFPCNVIIDSHIVNVWGKDPNARDREGKPLEYAPDVIIGEELSIRHRLGENMIGYFDEAYKFSKSLDGKRHSVEFVGNIARSMYDMPAGPQDVTDKPFYQYWRSLVETKPAPQATQKV